MAIIGTQAVKIEHSPVGGDPCTYAPTIVDGEMTWPGCHRPIGGNPNTWTPTHGPIGGNPDTWTPTNQIVGDNPCTWAPTIVDGRMTWPGCDEKNGLAQVFAEAKYCGNGWCESDDEQHMMGTDSDTYTPTHYIVGDNPCTWAPTIVDGKMTWPGCDEKNGLAQVDLEAEASAGDYSDGYYSGDFGGFAQVDAEFSITPGEEKMGMEVGEDVLSAAMAHGMFAQRGSG